MTGRRGGLGRGLGALIPSARPEGDEYAAGAGGSNGDGVPYGRPAIAAVPPSPGAVEASGSTEIDRASGVDTVHSPGPDVVGQSTIDPASAVIEAADTHGAAATDAAADLGSDATTAFGARFAELDPDTIQPNPRQPRQVFDEEELAELVHSIREIGVLQPVVVRQLSGSDGARYELVMGERRWRAAREAGLETVPAIIRDTPDTAMLRDALLENLHRAQLNPLEEAAAYDQLLQDFGCTQEELAERIGRSRPQISNTLRLLRLPPSVQRRLAAGVLSAGHARALLALPEAAAQERLAQRVVAEGLSVRSVEEIVAVGGMDGQGRGSSRTGTAPTPALTELATALADRFETRVRVDMGRTKGKLVIEFASLADLERIVALMGSVPTYVRGTPNLRSAHGSDSESQFADMATG